MIKEQEKFWSLDSVDSTSCKDWASENQDTLWTLARQGYSDRGRGVLIVDAMGEKQDTPVVLYLPQELLESKPHEESLIEKIRSYDPEKQIVMVIARGIEQKPIAFTFSLPNQADMAL